MVAMVSQTMNIRPLVPTDHAQWKPLWLAYLTFYESTLPEAQTELTFRRLTDPAFNLYGLVAEENGQLIGITHCLFHPSCWNEGGNCYLQDLFVSPNARSRGTGRALIQAVVDLARSKGAAKVYWHTMQDNHLAQLLYAKVAKRSGFIEYTIPLPRNE
jgi:ribosomal protein S18 acetylase RimI-like enzyme